MKFDKNKQYGACAEIVLGDKDGFSTPDPSAIYHIVGFKEWCEEAVELAKVWLTRHYKKHIPTEYQSCVKWIIRPPQPAQYWYHSGTIGWKYTPKAKSLSKHPTQTELVEFKQKLKTRPLTEDSEPISVKVILDCEKKDCIHYGGLGCHGCDDPMNQSCCWLELNEAKKCLNSKPEYIHYEAKS